MPYVFKREETGVHVRFTGVFSYRDNNEATAELYASPNIEGIQYIIWDFTRVTDMNMTGEETSVAATGDKLASSKLSDVKVVFITRDPFTIKLCHVYIAQCINLKMNWEFNISEDLKSARGWINT